MFNTYKLKTIIFTLFLFSSHAWANSYTDDLEQAMLLTPNLNNGRVLFEICAVCHSPNAWGSINGRYPQLAGQHPNVIIKQLADIRAGNRDNPTMYPFALESSLGGPQAIADVAAYISQLPMTPNNGISLGGDLIYGHYLYTKHCAKCHGDNGEGNNEDFSPRIQGQHFYYLLRQMRWIQIGKRRNVETPLTRLLRSYSTRELWAVADYISRLKPATAHNSRVE
jgi:cytochrome c553